MLQAGLNRGGQLTEQTVREYRYVATKVPTSRRLDGLGFGHHQAVASLDPDEQIELLEEAKEKGWTLAEFRREIRAHKRRVVMEGQAELARRRS